MKKHVFLMRRWRIWLPLAVLIILICSCAEGYDSPDGFDSGVRDTDLVTPDSVSFIVSTDGTSATISWPLVYGAAGYEVTFSNVDDPENPQIIDGLDKKLIDGSKMTVPVTEDSKYEFAIRVVGNKQLGNNDADAPTVYNFSTLVPSVAVIPSGEDISRYMAEHPLDTLGEEVAIDLEPGGEYILSDTVDFGPHNLTFRGDKIHRPTVKLQGKGTIMSYSGLKLKYINFDCSESTAYGVVGMSVKNLPEEIKSQNLGYTRDGSPINNIYIVRDPFYIAHCWFKDMPNALIFDNTVDCAWWHVTVDDCIVQQKNSGSTGLFCLQNKGRIIKNLRLANSTFYNVLNNAKAYFIRYANSSNANPVKVFGNATGPMSTQSITFSNCTLSKVYTEQKFVNNLNATGQVLTIDHTIFYDVHSVRQLPRYGGNKTFKFNFWWGITKIDNDDMKQKDSYGTPFAMDYDPQFRGDVMQSLDLSKPNGGVDFTPQQYEIVANRAGDPRWLEQK